MENFKKLSDVQLYIIYTELREMEEDGEFMNQDINQEYIDLMGIIQDEFYSRGYKNEQLVQDKFNSIYQEPNRKYH